MQVASKVDEIQERGFCSLDALFSPSECADMRKGLQGYWREQGAPPMKGFGFNIHPMQPKLPELGRHLVHPAIMEVLREAFNEDAKILHVGARMSDEHCDAAIGWHIHYSWDASNIPARRRCERLLAGIYVDGSSTEMGPLTAIPRRINDPIGEQPDGNDAREIHVEAPPGSVVIFDTALWHRAKRGSQSGVRHLFGAHYQPKSNMRPHPEDNDVCDLNTAM